MKTSLDEVLAFGNAAEKDSVYIIEKTVKGRW